MLNQTAHATKELAERYDQSTGVTVTLLWSFDTDRHENHTSIRVCDQHTGLFEEQEVSPPLAYHYFIHAGALFPAFWCEKAGDYDADAP